MSGEVFQSKPNALRNWLNVQEQWYNSYCQVSCVIKSILGGLYVERNTEEELYSFPSGSTYGLDVLERTLMNSGEIHSEHS